LTAATAEGRFRVCSESDVAPGQTMLVRGARRSVLLCRSADGEYLAVAPKCPHQGADLRYGTFGGAIVDDGVGHYRFDESCLAVRCPWHGWEYDARSGRPLAADNATHIAVYRVTVEDGEVYVDDTPTRQVAGEAS
jgi:3-phenylpropionate/trans-cinnamate dioxygenase ferredoxin subunit